MIFAHTLDNVLLSKKTQTRRLVKAGECLCVSQTLLGEVVYVHIPGKRRVYEVGKSYAVQPGRGKKAVARIKITNLKREKICSIRTQDAKAEGFTSRKAFFAAWYAIHGAKANLEAEVWVITFELENIVADDLKALYEQRQSVNQSVDHSDDISTSIGGLSGTHLYSGNYRT
jgi:hypothetical protein